MSTGSDVIAVVKSGYDIYKTAKKAKKESAAADVASKEDIARLKAQYTNLGAVVSRLPAQMTRTELKHTLEAAKDLAMGRLAEQDPIADLEEVQRLNSQIFVLDLALAKIAIQNAFQVAPLVSEKHLDSLAAGIQAVGEAIQSQLAVKAFYSVSIKVAIFTLNLAVLVAKTLM